MNQIFPSGVGGDQKRDKNVHIDLNLSGVQKNYFVNANVSA